MIDWGGEDLLAILWVGSAEGVVALDELGGVPVHDFAAVHVHIELAGASEEAPEEVEALAGLIGGGFAKPRIHQVAAAVHAKAVMNQALFQKAGAQAAAAVGGAASFEAKGDIVFSRNIRQAGVHQAVMISEAGVQVHVLVGNQQVTLLA